MGAQLKICFAQSTPSDRDLTGRQDGTNAFCFCKVFDNRIEVFNGQEIGGLSSGKRLLVGRKAGDLP